VSKTRVIKHASFSYSPEVVDNWVPNVVEAIEESWSGCAFNCKGGAFLIHQERMVTTYGGQLCEDVKVGFPSNTMIGIISGEPHMQSQFAT